MKSIGAKVSDKYYRQIEEIADNRGEPMSQIIIDAVDHYLIRLERMKIKRIFNPKITMED